MTFESRRLTRRTLSLEEDGSDEFLLKFEFQREVVIKLVLLSFWINVQAVADFICVHIISVNKEKRTAANHVRVFASYKMAVSV